MTKNEYEKIMREIEKLPTGGITYKKINGKEYAYYQWREDGKQRARRVKDDELVALLTQIEQRKNYYNRIKQYCNGINNIRVARSNNEIIAQGGYQFRCAVRVGETLRNYVKVATNWKKRECYDDLIEYVYGDVHDRVFILYGLRRTGKTTLIRQIISDMSEADFQDTVFIQITENKTLDDLNVDLKYLEECGYKYVFIDEVTQLSDFIEGAALLSDVYAASGMKIILSGTDSLGFMFSQDDELYDRCIMCHTTFIPYREFERVLGEKGIDDYIIYGGTMSISGIRYNGEAVFATKKSTDEYVDSAIARNIQHSLKNYQYGGHFRSLRELYEKDELTSAINRIIEDINHRFTLEVLTRDFKSNDLSISAKNLRKDRDNPTDILDRIDIEKVTNILKELLEIKNKDEQVVDIQDSHRYEIKEYLDLLDLTVEIENRWMSDYNKKESRTVFSQPGMRYSMAIALIKSLMQDDKFRDMSLEEKNRVSMRIIDEIKGRMMEDIVLLETKLARPDCEVFRLQFAIGEYDMVVFNPNTSSCEIYEVKHSKEIVSKQYRHLLDEEKCAQTRHRYGTITGKYVIYRGESNKLENVEYINVEEYLNSLGKY